jgi:hypothetical protein
MCCHIPQPDHAICCTRDLCVMRAATSSVDSRLSHKFACPDTGTSIAHRTERY